MTNAKLEAIKNRSSLNIKSGRVMMEVKDRDWLFATITNLLKGDNEMTNLEQYQKDAAVTRNKGENEIVNYGLGITGEAGEVADIIKKASFHGHELDIPELEKELGDVLWYLANIASVAGLDLSDIAEKNINKLKKRYPEGFSEERSINREA